MKTLKKLKLNQISKTNLEHQEMGKLSGGCISCGVVIWPDASCGCACIYAHNGGSSTSSNGSANHAGGILI